MPNSGWLVVRGHESVPVLPPARMARRGVRRPYPSEEPQRLTRLVLRALAEDLITESRGAELLGKSLGEFRRTEGEKHAGFPVGVRG